MFKKIFLLTGILIFTGWGFNNKPKDLYSYVESARPSQTRTLKALAARLYLEALNATEDILKLANSLCNCRESNAGEENSYTLFAAEHGSMKQELEDFIGAVDKREETVRTLTKEIIAAFKTKISKIEDKYVSNISADEQKNQIKALLDEYKKALHFLNISYESIISSLKRVKATYSENKFSLPAELTLKTLLVDEIIKQSNESDLQDWTMSEFCKNSLCNLQQ